MRCMDCSYGYLVECPDCHNPVVLCSDGKPSLRPQTYWEEDCGCQGLWEE